MLATSQTACPLVSVPISLSRVKALVIVKFFRTFVSSSNDDWHQDSGDKLWLHATRLKGPNQPPIMYNKTIKITIKVQGR